MIDEKSPTDDCPGMNLYPREKSASLGNHSRQQPKSALPEEVRKPVYPEGLKARIA